MTYWHMQLHPYDDSWNREKELLEKLSLIGLGVVENNYDNPQNKQFIKDMEIGDIVLVRYGNIPKALVEVIGEIQDIDENDYERLDWFRYRREIKVLDWATDKIDKFPQPRGTLQKLINKKTSSYKYIENWHKKISPSFYRSQKGLKLQKIYIQKYNMFKEFNLNFNEQVTIVAGINGSGKTTLLEYIDNFSKYIADKDDDKSSIEFKMYNEDLKKTKSETLEYRSSQSLSSKYFENNIVYFPTGTDIKNIKEFLPKYLHNMVWVDKINVDDAYAKVRKFINHIFKELNIMIEFDSRDVEGNLFFRNKKAEVFSIDKISTGEKTLLSKVLYLYIKDIKDKVILIDEPELSLHPSWQNKILKLYGNFAKDNNCQIIIATHSPHIIGSAKNEYIRLLTINEKNEVEVINDVLAYGRDIEWVLEEVMGATSKREVTVAKKIKECQELLNEDKYDEAEELIDALEVLIGANDKEVLALRNSLEFWRE